MKYRLCTLCKLYPIWPVLLLAKCFYLTRFEIKTQRKSTHSYVNGSILPPIISSQKRKKFPPVIIRRILSFISLHHPLVGKFGGSPFITKVHLIM